MGRRHHRDGLDGQVHAVLLAGLVDIGEPLHEKTGRLVGDVEEHAVCAARLHLRVDAPGHRIAGGQVAARVVLRHEGFALLIDEHPALAAHRLGDEEVFRLAVEEAGRVKLDELQVGHPGPGPVGHGHAVTGGDVRVGGVQVDLAAPAGAQHGHPGQAGLHLAGDAVEHVRPQAAVPLLPLTATRLGFDEQVDGQVVLQHLDVRMLGDLRQQGPLDLLAGEVGGVRYPAGGVAALHAEIELLAVLPLLKAHPELDQFTDPGRPLGGDDTDDCLVAQAVTGDQGVVHMGLDGILHRQDRRHPALGQVGRRVRLLFLGDQRDPGKPGHLEGEREPGHAAADDEYVTVCRHTCAPHGHVSRETWGK